MLLLENAVSAVNFSIKFGVVYCVLKHKCCNTAIFAVFVFAYEVDLSPLNLIISDFNSCRGSYC